MLVHRKDAASVEGYMQLKKLTQSRDWNGISETGMSTVPFFVEVLVFGISTSRDSLIEESIRYTSGI